MGVITGMQRRLGSDFRDQEIRYVEWRDVDFRNYEGARETCLVYCANSHSVRKRCEH